MLSSEIPPEILMNGIFLNKIVLIKSDRELHVFMSQLKYNKNNKSLMNNIAKYVLIGFGAVAGLIGLLIAKNTIARKSARLLHKAKIFSIIKKIRKDNLSLYRRFIIPLYNNLMVKYKGKISAEQFRSYVESPGSELSFTEKMEGITIKACEKQGTTKADFVYSLEVYRKDLDIANKIKVLTRQYELAFQGKEYQATHIYIPKTLTPEKVLQIQHKIKKQKILIELNLMRNIVNKSKKQLQDNPEIMENLKDPQKEQQRILAEQGLDDGEEPAMIIYNAAIRNFTKQNSKFKKQFQKIETKFNKVIDKYLPALQKNHSPELFDAIEQQIIFLS